MEEEEKYLNYVLHHGDMGRSFDGYGYYVQVYGDSERLFTEISFINGTAISKHFSSNNKRAYEHLKSITISKAKARIFMNIYEVGQEYRQNILSATEDITIGRMEDNEIKIRLLTALNNIRRNNPGDYTKIIFEIDGFCHLLGIENKNYLYCAGLLLEEGLISEVDFESFKIHNGGIFINASGVRIISAVNTRKFRKGEDDVTSAEYEYDVAISFAGEDRKIAKEIATELIKKEVKVFYDDFETEILWGRNLFDHLEYIYTDAARVCIMILSEHYARKSWSSHERKSAQARAFRQSREYILPVKLDNTKIPGLTETVGYIEYKDYSASKIAELTIKKLATLS